MPKRDRKRPKKAKRPKKVKRKTMVKRIVKIAENNVEVTPTKKALDTDGNEVKIWDKAKTVSYGQRRITEMRGIYEQELSEAQNLDTTQYKNDLIARRQTDVDKISALRTIIPTLTAENAKGNIIQIFDVSGSEAYEELINDASQYRKRLTEAQDLNVAQYKKDLVDKCQEKVDEINLIQAEMNR